MPQKAKHDLPPLNLGKETIGQRIARMRKAKGYTQIELCQKIGIRQVLLSDYERGRLRPNYEMIIRFAQALQVSSDELLGLTASKGAGDKPSLKIIRRLKQIEGLPDSQQKALMKTIDNFIKGAQKAG